MGFPVFTGPGKVIKKLNLSTAFDFPEAYTHFLLDFQGTNQCVELTGSDVDAIVDFYGKHRWVSTGIDKLVKGTNVITGTSLSFQYERDGDYIFPSKRIVLFAKVLMLSNNYYFNTALAVGGNTYARGFLEQLGGFNSGNSLNVFAVGSSLSFTSTGFGANNSSYYIFIYPYFNGLSDRYRIKIRHIGSGSETEADLSSNVDDSTGIRFKIGQNSPRNHRTFFLSAHTINAVQKGILSTDQINTLWAWLKSI